MTPFTQILRSDKTKLRLNKSEIGGTRKERAVDRKQSPAQESHERSLSGFKTD